jgi:hypothetical protein
MTEPDYTIESLVAEVCERFGDDPSAPAVLVSRLPSEEWYMSVQRFTEAFGKGRQVIVSEKDRSSKMCLSLLWQRWETWKKSVDSVRRDAMQTVALAVEAKKNKYNSGPKSPEWQPVPSVTGTRGEVDPVEELARIEKRRAGLVPSKYSPSTELPVVNEKMRREMERWVPQSFMYDASAVLWHEPGGGVFVLKNKYGSYLTKLTRKEASALVQNATSMGRDVIVCAFPCGYRQKIEGVWEDSVQIPEDWTDASGQRGEAVRKELKKVKPAPVPKVAGSRFNVLEVDDEEDE